MTGVLVTLALILGALLLTVVAPRLLARWVMPRRAPGAGLFLWQMLSLSAIACALLAAPVAALTFGTRYPWLLTAALTVSALMLAGLLWSGHRIGSDLRRMRREHRAIIDLVGDQLDTGRHHSSVIAHANPTAYCLPGRHDRIVLSQAAVDRLAPEELTAVLEHERAHLKARHDLLLELFTVLHSSVPAPIRSAAALREVHLLVEALADRVAKEQVSAPVLARALVAMATARGTGDPATLSQPALSVVGGTEQVRIRLGLLAQPAPPRAFAVILFALGLIALLLPWLLAFSQV